MYKKIVTFIILSGSIILACKKTNTIPDRTSGIPANSAFLKGIHVSPDAPLFNIMVDSTRVLTVTGTSNDVESGIGFGGVIPFISSGYAVVSSGSHTLSAKVPSTSTTLAGQTIVSKLVNFTTGTYYTVAIVDSLSRLDAVLIEDDLKVPDTSKAYFRIANFMLKGTADIEFVRTGVANFSKNNLAFKNVTPFDTLTQGTYKVYLRANGSATKLDSITAFAPLKGKKYTLYTRGVVGQTGSTNTKRPLIFQIQNL